MTVAETGSETWSEGGEKKKAKIVIIDQSRSAFGGRNMAGSVANAGITGALARAFGFDAKKFGNGDGGEAAGEEAAAQQSATDSD